MTDVALQPLTNAETIFKQIVWDPMVRAGEVALEGAVPALNFPVLKQLDEAAIEAVMDGIFHWLVMFTDVTALKIKNAEHQRAYDSESIRLEVIAADKGIDSAEFKKARTAALDTMARFTHIGPQRLS